VARRHGGATLDANAKSRVDVAAVRLVARCHAHAIVVIASNETTASDDYRARRSSASSRSLALGNPEACSPAIA
jgi:hypothetical protein